jgi:hypothetical protein
MTATTATTLTDRYVYAAMRTVPEAQRADLGAELRGSIDDQVEARVAEGEAPSAAERAVLTDLGDPDKLAAGYTERPLYLIGPAYFLDWWRLLKLLLWIVLPSAAFGITLAQVLAGADSVGVVIGTVIPVLLSVTVHLGFWTVLVFAIVERSTKGERRTPLTPWTVDQLPEPSSRGAGFGDMVGSLVFLAAGAGAILWDLFVGFVPTEPGLSFLNPGLWPNAIFILFGLMALEAGLAIAVYAVRRWTIGLAIVNGLLNLAIAVPAVWLLMQGELINPEYFPTIIEGGSGAEVQTIVTVIVGFVIVGAAGWDTIDASLKAVRARRS